MWPCTGAAAAAAAGTVWWRDPLLRVGALTAAPRRVRVRNVLTQQEDEVEVAGEETVGEVQERYLRVNAHAGSYTWKALVRVGGGGRGRREDGGRGTEPGITAFRGAGQGRGYQSVVRVGGRPPQLLLRCPQRTRWRLLRHAAPPPHPRPPPAPRARRQVRCGRGAAPEWAELDMARTLADNGLPDEAGSYEDAGLAGDEAVPVLHLYWNDDLTVA